MWDFSLIQLLPHKWFLSVSCFNPAIPLCCCTYLAQGLCGPAPLVSVRPRSVARFYPLSSLCPRVSRCYFSTASEAHAASPAAPREWKGGKQRVTASPPRRRGPSCALRPSRSVPGRPGGGPGPAVPPAPSSSLTALSQPPSTEPPLEPGEQPGTGPSRPATGCPHLPARPAAILPRLVRTEAAAPRGGGRGRKPAWPAGSAAAGGRASPLA